MLGLGLRTNNDYNILADIAATQLLYLRDENGLAYKDENNHILLGPSPIFT